MVSAILDTDIVIDLLREYPPADRWIHTQEHLGIPIVVWYEVIRGTRNKREMTSASRLLNKFESIPLTSNDQQWGLEQLAVYRHSHDVEIFDCLIAAVGHRLQIPVYTKNLKHFEPMIGDLARRPYD